MVKSLNLLRNVGKFDNVTSGASLPFGRLTVVYAENARGKTTLAAILRSLASGHPEPVTERTRLGQPDLPHIVVDTGTAPPAVFQNGSWSRTASEIVIFDDIFVSENVHSGIQVGAAQRQNLHELIVGAPGIALARAVQVEVEKVEVHNRTLRQREAAIPERIRGELSVDAFCALEAVPDIDERIQIAERRLAAARDASNVAEMGIFVDVKLPKIDADALQSLLTTSLSELETYALDRVREHFERMGSNAENWVGQGMAHADALMEHGNSECPFCAQPLADSPLFAHYRAFFGEEYRALTDRIATAIADFRSTQAGDVPAAFERGIREAVEKQSFWKDFAEVPSFEVPTESIALVWKSARQEVRKLLDAKRASPLEPVHLPESAIHAIYEHNQNCDRVSEFSETLTDLNSTLEVVKEDAREANIASLVRDLSLLKVAKVRHESDVDKLCKEYLSERKNKETTEQRREAARDKLNLHRQAAFPAYGIAINDFLGRFNASFRLGPVDAVNTRGGSAANYELLIDGNAVPLTGKPGQPSFGNTLSAGDRSTLALAFFFASLESDPDLSKKVIVIDDPMTSLDEHRVLHTLQEIDRALYT